MFIEIKDPKHNANNIYGLVVGNELVRSPQDGANLVSNLHEPFTIPGELLGLSPASILTYDDFIAGCHTSFAASVGQLSWYNAVGGTGGISATQEEEHPGIINLATGIVPGSLVHLHIPAEGAIPGFVKFSDKWNVQTVVKLVSVVTAGAQTAITMGDTIGYGGQYIRFEKLFADSNIFAATSNGTTVTRTDVLVPASDTWYRFGMRKERGNTANVIFSINGVDVATANGVSLPSANRPLAAQFLVNNNAAADKQLWVDYWQIQTGNTLPTGLGVR